MTPLRALLLQASSLLFAGLACAAPQHAVTLYNEPPKYHRHATATGHTAFHSHERMPTTTATRKIAVRRSSPTSTM